MGDEPVVVASRLPHILPTPSLEFGLTLSLTSFDQQNVVKKCATCEVGP